MRVRKRVVQLRDKALGRGDWTVVAAASDLLEHWGDLDRCINLLGAMHQVSYPRNRLRPYWRDLAARTDEWVGRCLERMLTGDFDHWAVSALLGNDPDICFRLMHDLGLERAFVYQKVRTNDSRPRIEVWGKVCDLQHRRVHLLPAVEIGWDKDPNETTVVSRCRSLDVAIYPRGANERGPRVRGSTTAWIGADLPTGWDAPGNRHFWVAEGEFLEDHTHLLSSNES
jgi:hypothetical protein